MYPILCRSLPVSGQHKHNRHAFEKKKRLEFLWIHRVEDSKRDKLTVLPRPGHQPRGTRGEQFPQHLRVGQAAWKVGVCYPHTMTRHVLLF